MKDTLTDANFPRTADGRVYHLGTKPGDVANRIITVGTPSRARTIASFFDATPEPFVLTSERGFLTITGKYHGTPISVIAIGMGYPNLDFMVREVRECIVGDMIVVRLGSCGALIDVPVASIVIPKACISVNRNLDFDFGSDEAEGSPYRVSKPVNADPELSEALNASLQAAQANKATPVVTGITNASADSFYSSQGRQTSFPDHNSELIEKLANEKGASTLEMETFHLYHLAACWNNRSSPQAWPKIAQTTVPLATGPVRPAVVQGEEPSGGSGSDIDITARVAKHDTKIRAGAVQMVFAARVSQDFITPAQVVELEAWAGRSVLDAVCAVGIEEGKIHPHEGSVWSV